MVEVFFLHKRERVQNIFSVRYTVKKKVTILYLILYSCFPLNPVMRFTALASTKNSNVIISKKLLIGDNFIILFKGP